MERDEKFGESTFSLNSDGSRENLIKIDAGGYRNPSSVETLKEKVVDEYGNIRSDEQAYMNGGDVFTFVNREFRVTLKIRWNIHNGIRIVLIFWYFIRPTTLSIPIG